MCVCAFVRVRQKAKKDKMEFSLFAAATAAAVVCTRKLLIVVLLLYFSSFSTLYYIFKKLKFFFLLHFISQIERERDFIKKQNKQINDNK
jgi:hypothetical protein